MNDALERLRNLTQRPLQHPLSAAQREQLIDDLDAVLSGQIEESGAAIRLQFVVNGRPTVAYPDAFSPLQTDQSIVRDIRSVIQCANSLSTCAAPNR